MNLERYVQSGTVHLRAELAYDAPTPAFTASIAGVFYLGATIDHGKEIGL